MKKYFVIKDENYIKEYEKYEKDYQSLGECFNILKAEFELETDIFYHSIKRLMLKLTSSDFKRFKTDVLKDDDRKFKSNSAINKRWMELMKQYEITHPEKPDLAYTYIKRSIGGGYSWNVVKIDNVLYGFFDNNRGDITLIGTLEEIKASEYYKVLEEEDEKRKDENKACGILLC